MKSFSLSQLFSVGPLPPSASHLDLFTHKIEALPIKATECAGPGIYAISRRDDDVSRLIYIGMHATESPFYKDRVLKHLQTFVPIFPHAMALGIESYQSESISELKICFDHKFHFSGCAENPLYKYVKNNLTRVPHRNSIYPPVDSFLGRATKQIKNSSIETSSRRFQYACYFWKEIKEAADVAEYLDKHYEFHWFRKTYNRDVSKSEITRTLKLIEKYLIYKYRPVLNKEMNKLSGEGELHNMLESSIGQFKDAHFRPLLRDMAKDIRNGNPLRRLKGK
jgi:hypothetical protein